MSSVDDSENEGLQLAGAKDSIYGDREQAEITQDSLDEQELSLDNEIREEQQKLNEERERLSRRRTQSTTGPWDLNETMVRAIASREGSPEPVGWTQITNQTAIQPAESKTMIRENWNNCGKDDLTSPKMRREPRKTSGMLPRYNLTLVPRRETGGQKTKKMLTERRRK